MLPRNRFPQKVDVLIVGGGMAGFSLAATIAGSGAIALLEQEDAPGYHATGRSVAFWEESYGGPGVQPLTTASGPLLEDFLSARGSLHIGRAGDEPLMEDMRRSFATSGVALHPVTAQAMMADVPGLREDWALGLREPSCRDIDAAALLAHYVRLARSGGVVIGCNTRFLTARRDGAGWIVETTKGEIRTGCLVNAAGAWADQVASHSGVNPVGVMPLRRTVVQLRCPGVAASLPLVADFAGSFYFKPSGEGRVWLTPHDESPDCARDVAPEEMDVAIAIDRFQAVVDWRIEAVERRWAGLRSFTPDRLPVYGPDAREPAFFWFAGQGGFGIQTAPAAALIGAALLSGESLPSPVRHIDADRYASTRFMLAQTGSRY